MLQIEDPTDDNIKADNIVIRVDGDYVFQEGETFDSYEELLERMDKHTKESLVYYWRRDSRTVQRAFTKTSRPIASKLRYYFVRFACIYGGMKFQTRGAGRRVSQSVRTDCPAHIFLRASKCGQKLEVISVCNDHNHEISEKASQSLPQNRRLPKRLKEEVWICGRRYFVVHDMVRQKVLEMLKLKIERKKIIEYVRQRENKKIISKDLFNLAARLKGNDLPTKPKERVAILRSILDHTTENSIKAVISKELKVCEKLKVEYNEEDSIADNSQVGEYISPEHEFVVNETIIDSLVKAQRCEIEESMDIFLKSPVSHKESLHGHAEPLDAKTEMMNEDLIGKNGETPERIVSCSNNSPVIVYEDFINQDESYFYDSETLEDTDVKSINNYSELPNDSYGENISNSCDVLYEAIGTDDVNVEEDKLVIKNRKQKKREYTNSNLIVKSARKSRKRILNCRKCGTNAKLIKMQINYLKAKKSKLLAETKLLQLKKRKLEKDMLPIEEV